MEISPRLTLMAALVAVLVGGTACTSDKGNSKSRTAAAGSSAGAEAKVGTTVEWPVTECGTYSGTGCAPTSARVDVKRPRFSNPTDITNPLFPISELDSVVLLGKVDGLPFRSETTLLAGKHSVIVDGKPIKVVVSQYTAYLDGRIEEVALDRYAQADDGSVWYLGEDVFDYRDGAVAITEGTWLAGRDGPPAMIMPADPKVGDVFRAENVIGVVFEEIEVKALDQTVEGPRGPVKGAVVMQELHLDGSYSDKVFAPGYGEFDTSSDGDVEALAVRCPLTGSRRSCPESSDDVHECVGMLENVRLDDWEAAGPTLERTDGLWRALRAKNYPPRVVETMDRAMNALTKAIAKKDVAASSQAAVDVAQSALDLELLYRGNVEIDRFNLHTQQLRVHAAAKDMAGVAAEVVVLEWIRDRVAPSLSRTRLGALDADLRALRGAADARNMSAASDHAARASAQLRRA